MRIALPVWMAVASVCGLGRASAYQAIDTSFQPPTLTKDSQLDELAKAYAPERMSVRPAPRVGLALSGGGTRAAYFALGVMTGLNDSGALDHVDAISSVSGGGYAALWFYSKRYLAAKEGWDYRVIFGDCFPAWLAQTDKMKFKAHGEHLNSVELKMQEARSSEKAPDKDPSLRRFADRCDDRNTVHWLPADPTTHRGEDPYVWQAYLARWPNLMSEHPEIITGDSQAVYNPITAKRILQIYFSDLRGRHASGRWYEQGIERVWWQAPEPRHYAGLHCAAQRGKPFTGCDATALEAEAWKWKTHTDQQLVSFDQLQDFTLKDPSVPFWIINTNVGKSKAQSNVDHIFELTPYAYGSGKTHYAVGHIPDVNLVKATKLSGAFLDSQNAITGTQLDVGAHLAQWLTFGDLRWGEKVATPGLLPRHFGLRYRLSDGGGEENLGLYSLVRRGVRNIIVVDGEQDAPGKLEALCRNWSTLKQAGWHLDIPKLQSLGDTCSREEQGKPSRGYNTSAWLNVAMRGAVWPARDDHAPPGSAAMADRQRNTINLVYIKLGWDEQSYRDTLNQGDCETERHDLSCFLTLYVGANGDRKDKFTNPKDRWMYFPQLMTVGITKHASSYQFWGLRELGREAGRRIHLDRVGQNFLLPPEQVQAQLTLTYPRDDGARAAPNCRPDLPPRECSGK